jgi:hypothetical protein
MDYLYPKLGKYYPAARDPARQARKFVWENQQLSTLAALRTGLRDIGGETMARKPNFMRLFRGLVAFTPFPLTCPLVTKSHGPSDRL